MAILPNNESKPTRISERVKNLLFITRHFMSLPLGRKGGLGEKYALFQKEAFYHSNYFWGEQKTPSPLHLEKKSDFFGRISEM